MYLVHVHAVMYNKWWTNIPIIWQVFTWLVIMSLVHGISTVTKHDKWSRLSQTWDWPCILHGHSQSRYWECMHSLLLEMLWRTYPLNLHAKATMILRCCMEDLITYTAWSQIKNYGLWSCHNTVHSSAEGHGSSVYRWGLLLEMLWRTYPLNLHAKATMILCCCMEDLVTAQNQIKNYGLRSCHNTIVTNPITTLLILISALYAIFPFLNALCLLIQWFLWRSY